MSVPARAPAPRGVAAIEAAAKATERAAPPGHAHFPIIAASSVPTVTAATMAEVDRLAVEEFGIDLLQMMELAGSHLAEVVREEVCGSLVGRRVVVAAGPGNNGGGGLSAARHLVDRGADVLAVLARPALRIGEAGRHHLATLVAMGVDCCVMTYDMSDADLATALARADVVVDAIVGYNLHGAPRGEVGALIEAVAQCGAPVVSLDVPSGMDPDTGAAAGAIAHAAATLTLALPKPGLLTEEGARHAGRLLLGDIGLPAALYNRLGIDVGTPFADGRIVELDRTR